MAEFDLKSVVPGIIALVLGVILLIVGAVAGSITGAVGQTIINTFNTSGVKIPGSMNYLNSVNGMIAPVFTIIGVVILVMAVVWIIVILIRSFSGIQQEANL